LIFTDFTIAEQLRSRQLALPVAIFFRGLMADYGESMEYFPEAPPRTSFIQAREGRGAHFHKGFVATGGYDRFCDMWLKRCFTESASGCDL